jgi:hypothetical protein
LKKPIPVINATLPSFKPRISPLDAVRPTNTLPAHYRTYTADNEYLHLQDARSGYHPNETNSFSIDLSNDSFYQPSPPDNFRQGYDDHDLPGQFIYYEDEFGNEFSSPPDEISF